MVKITMLCGASGFLSQGPQQWLHPEHCIESDKTRPQNHSKHQHTLTQGAEESNLQQHYPSLSPHVLRYLLSELAAWYHQREPQSSCSTCQSHGTIPALRSSLPIPRCARGAVPPSHFLMGHGGLCWCPSVVQGTLSSSCCTWECCLNTNRAPSRHDLFFLTCAQIHIYISLYIYIFYILLYHRTASDRGR